MNQLPPRPSTRSDGSPWFLNDDSDRYPVSQAFETGPTIKEIDRDRDSAS